MIARKSSIPALPALARSTSQLQRMKELNHEFFLLVRDQKYEEALTVGTLYLQFFPDNQAVQQFCYFIQHNRQQLQEMVDQQNNYTDEDSEEEEEDEEEDDEDETESVASLESRASIVSKAKSTLSSVSAKSLKAVQSSKKSLGKENVTMCPGHKWQHNCKNKDCPNKKKR